MIPIIIASLICIDLPTLAKIESGGNDRKIGSHGERGRYQMTAKAWREVTPEPHKNAHIKSRSDVNASKYLDKTQQRLKTKLGRNPTDRELWKAWNMGVTGSMTKPESEATKRGYKFIK